jgi:predicted ribosomally synthesized peptide with SipW-like signal peptide
MKKILGLSLAALLVIAMVAGGTFAYFQDVEISDPNTITAGSLNLTEAVVYGGGTITGVQTAGVDGATEYLTFSNVKPGDSGKIQFTLSNTGSLDGMLSIAASTTTPENVAIEPELTNGDAVTDTATSGELGTVMVFSLTKDGTSVDLDPDGVAPGLTFNLAQLEAYFDSITTTNRLDLPKAGGAIVYILSWSIPATGMTVAGSDGYFDTITPSDHTVVNDNVIQTDSITLSLTFTLDQQ